MLVVIDTNVLVSALLRQNSAPGKILDLVLSGTLRVVLDIRVLTEYQSVLQRPRFQLAPEQVKAVLNFISVSGCWFDSQPLHIAKEDIPDIDDLPFAELAVSSGAAALITGNVKHYPYLGKFSVKVLTPQMFLSEFDV
ncbi:MAG: putative toxin-antitoxin system toxin component, PIN family [Anaerolineae bacterium]|nr:putative toxin-antitoxin system toxin component, PIN family [Anaerolineae bacterium]